MKKSFIFILGFLFIIVAFLPEQTEAQGWRGAPGRSWQPGMQGGFRSPQAAPRGMWQPGMEPLALQLDGLTQEQRTQLNELHQEHRTQMSHLFTLLQNARISSEEFESRRQELFDRHQEQLQQVLTDAQWEELQALRTERRTLQRDQRTTFHTTRMRMIAGELELDEATTEQLVAIVRDRQEQMDEIRGPVDEAWGMRGYNVGMRRDVHQLSLEFYDQVRELLDEETYLEWRWLWTSGAGAGHRHRGASFMTQGNFCPYVGTRWNRGASFGPGFRGW